MPEIVGVRFQRAGRVFYFDPSGIPLQPNDSVVVKTSRGLELGRVIIAPKQVLDSEITEPLQPVVRKAEPEDIKRAEDLAAREESALIESGKLIDKLKLPMKLISADYNLEGNRLTIFFSAEERVDFRELVRELVNHFKIKVELRQIGPRDATKISGGFGRCGRQMCCASFLDDFAPVSIKMAKEQNLPLNPMKISGCCGRLMCCLTYENDQYRDMRAKLPRIGAKVSTSEGKGSVVGGNIIKETATVQLESEAVIEVPLAGITVLQEPPPRPRETPRSRARRDNHTDQPSAQPQPPPPTAPPPIPGNGA